LQVLFGVTVRFKLWIISAVVIVVILLLGAFALSTRYFADDGLAHGPADFHLTGTITAGGVEGPRYGIVGDDGNHYEPINLPNNFQIYGLRVRFSANHTDFMSFHMWGYIIRLISIERLP